MLKKYVVIMAGGCGERFWPLSRQQRPKQLLKLFNDKSMLQSTVERVSQLVSNENIIILTNKDYQEFIINDIPQLPAENIIAEPLCKDTGPCFALATAIVKNRSNRHENSVIAFLPSDHVINDIDAFRETLGKAFTEAAKSEVVTIGTLPTRPSSDYGYIKFNANSVDNIYDVIAFKEKPNRELAQNFINSGNYFWNSGIFVWNLQALVTAFEQYSKSLYQVYIDSLAALNKSMLNDKITAIFEQTEKISIDYAIMEKVSNIKVIKANFDWNDVGNWTSLSQEIAPDGYNNVIKGNVVNLGSSECIAVTEDNDSMIALIDVDDLVIVKVADATLVCNKKSTHKIKALLELLKNNNQFNKYL